MSVLAAAGRLAVLELLARRRRILALLAFAGVFLVAAGAAATLGRQGGHVELDPLYRVGGYPLVSGILLAGWLLGRFPLVATLVLMAGFVSGDDAAGHRRLLAVRPASPVAIYGLRFVVLAGLAFAISAVLMPIFDLILLGEWAGPATLVLITAHVLVWGGLTALLSVFTRLDAWVALLLAATAMVWSALAAAGLMPLAPPFARLVAAALPPQADLFALEAAFGDLAPIPWDAFAFAAAYGFVALLLAGLLLGRREI